MAQALRGKFPCSVARKTERFGDGRAKQGIAKRVEHQRQRALGDMMVLMADGQLRDEAANGIEDRVQRIAVAGENHPGGKGAGAFAAERVEALVDDYAGVRFSGSGSLHRLADARRHGVGDRLRQLALKAGRRAKMMEKVGVGAAYACCDGLERNCRWPVSQEQLARGFKRGGTAFLRAQAPASY